MSIGGLYALRWTAEYPETVSAIYLDAPVTTIYSSKPAFRKVYEKAYNLKGQELLDSPMAPNNSCKVIAKAGIPVIAIRHGEDQTVPNKTNFDIFAKNFRAAGGKLFRDGLLPSGWPMSGFPFLSPQCKNRRIGLMFQGGR